jgi:eukaryotic-like serine/threonine-protein kinase
VPEVKGAQPRVRFEAFELNLRSGELCRKGGRTVRLSGQPFRILVLLLEHSQQVVSREELRKKLWPNDTIVEFEHSISAAMNRLRLALGDCAERPHYIETLARQGYRWMVPVEQETSNVATVNLQTPAVSPENLIGRKVSHYRVLELIGGGGMGVVYKAEDLKLGRQVALKFLPEELTKDPLALGRFEREARAASSLDHPNICAIYEFDEHEGQPFIVMQLLEGQTLRERIAAQGSAIPTDELIEIAIQIIEGLEAAHSKSIIHRDIKPANIFITTRAKAKILDFGLAKLYGTTHDINTTSGTENVKAPRGVGEANVPTSWPAALELSKTGQTIGTASYMSPEQVRCDELDGRTDLFSLGLVLYEMATSQQAFTGNTAALLHDAILHHTPISARVLNPLVPHKVDEIITRCIQKDRELRYQSASDIRADLRRLNRDPESGRTENIRRATVEQEGMKAPRRLLPGVWGAIAIAALVIATIPVPLFLRVPVAFPRVVHTIQLTSDGQKKIPKAFSPPFLATDGLRVYFTEVLSDRSAVAAVSVSGGETIPIRTPFNDAVILNISPDSSELLVTDGYPDDERPFWMVPVFGGSPHRLGNISGHSGSWSSDGQKFGYANGSDLYVAKADGSEPHKLVSTSLDRNIRAWDLRWSPDGSLLRFYQYEHRNHTGTLWEVSANGTNLHALLPGSHNECCSGGTWTPDGKYFFFGSFKDLISRNIWAIPEKVGLFQRSSREPVQLTGGPLDFWGLLPSKDSKRLFALGSQRRGELMQYDKKSQRFLRFLPEFSAEGVSFSKDGAWIAYVKFPQGELWRSKADGSEPLQLTFHPLIVHEPHWSPDAKRIAYSGLNPGGQWQIYIVSADGGASERLLPESLAGIDPTWSPDGKSLLFGQPPGTDASQVVLQTLNLQTHCVSPVPSSQGLRSPRLSPDGRYISAISDGADELVLFDVASQKRIEQAPGMATGWQSWSRDAKYVYFYGHPGVEYAVFRVAVGNKRPEKILSLRNFRTTGRFGGRFSLTPNEDLLVLRDVGTQEIYALEWESP